MNEKTFTALVESLDSQSPLPQLHPQPRIIINGQPFGSQADFIQLWNSLPNSNHQITSYDTHQIPGTSTHVVLAHLKVRFDESGKDRSGQCTLLNTPASSIRSIWSHWFGVDLSCVVEEQNGQILVNTWNYRFAENPSSTIYKVI